MKNIRIGIGLSIQGMSWCVVCQTDQQFHILAFEEHPVNENLLADTLRVYPATTIFSEGRYIKGICQRRFPSDYFRFRFHPIAAVDDAGCAIAECINSGRLILDKKDETLFKRVVALDWLEANEKPSPAFYALKNGLGEWLNELWGIQPEKVDEGFSGCYRPWG